MSTIEQALCTAKGLQNLTEIQHPLVIEYAAQVLRSSGERKLAVRAARITAHMTCIRLRTNLLLDPNHHLRTSEIKHQYKLIKQHTNRAKLMTNERLRRQRMEAQRISNRFSGYAIICKLVQSPTPVHEESILGMYCRALRHFARAEQNRAPLPEEAALLKNAAFEAIKRWRASVSQPKI